MNKETSLSLKSVISELTKSTHGDLKSYLPVGHRASKEEPEFMAHLLSWNYDKGQIRDSKVALPISTLGVDSYPKELVENSLASLALLDPRNLLRAVRFSKEAGIKGNNRKLHKLVEQYLRTREANHSWWSRTAVQHRTSLKELYALLHIKPNTFADNVLFKGQKPKGTIFESIANLSKMSPKEAAGTIINEKIPFLIAMGALGKKAQEVDLVLALIERMSSSELINNSKMLEKLGIKTNPALRAAYQEALAKATTSTKNTLKAAKAIESVSDEGLKDKLRAVQEKQMQNISVEGDWLILGDKSGSMGSAIDLSRQISGTLSKLVKGKVHLIFFDTVPRYLDVTGKDYDTILKETKLINANGGTSIGCGLQYAINKGLDFDGIVVVSDGGENGFPLFAPTYTQYCRQQDKEIPVYFYKLTGEMDVFSLNCKRDQIDVQEFDLRGSKLDYYSLPNLVQTMRVNKFSLVDEILSYPLKTLDSALKNKYITEIGA